jgi:hypothetical protein
MRTIEKIRDRRAEVERQPLGQPELLCQAQVVDIQPGPFQDIDARVSKSPDILPLISSADRFTVGATRYFEGGDVEPPLHTPLVARQIAAADAIRDAAARVGVRDIECGEAGRKEGSQYYGMSKRL